MLAEGWAAKVGWWVGPGREVFMRWSEMGGLDGTPRRTRGGFGRSSAIRGFCVLRLLLRFRFGLNGKKKNGAPNNVSSQTKNYEIAPFILG